MATKILLTNYPRIWQHAEFECVDDKSRLDIITGYDIKPDPGAVTLSIIRDMLNALLAYDEIYIEGHHLSDIIQVFGPECLKQILRTDILRVIPDLSLNPVMKKAKGPWEPSFFSYSHASGPVNGPVPPDALSAPGKWDHVGKLFREHRVEARDTDVLLYMIDEHAVSIDEKMVADTVIRKSTETLQMLFLPESMILSVHLPKVCSSTLLKLSASSNSTRVASLAPCSK